MSNYLGRPPAVRYRYTRLQSKLRLLLLCWCWCWCWGMVPACLPSGGSQGGQEPEGSATLNPRLACHGCPPTDTRLPVNNSQVVPFAAVGLLARRDRSLLSA